MGDDNILIRSDFDVKDYLCCDTPGEFYRIGYPESQTTYKHTVGFEAIKTALSTLPSAQGTNPVFLTL